MMTRRENSLRTRGRLGSKGAAPSYGLFTFSTIALFIVLLAGQFSFERVGRENPFLLPERTAGTIAIALLASIVWVSYPTSGIWRSRSTALTLLLSAPLYLATSTGWSPGGDPSIEALIDLLTILLLMYATALLLSVSADRFCTTLLWCMALAGSIYSLAGLASAGAGARVSVFGGGPNVYARVTMMGLIGLCGLAATKKVPMGALFLAPLYVAATVLSGSRGGILAGVVALLLLAPLVRRFSLGQLIFLWLTGAAAAYVIYARFGGLVSSTIQDRIVDLTLNQKYSSGRGDLASGSISLFWENFWIGSGIGGFADYYGQGFTYPHNLVLQIAAEGGLAGCALFLFALGAVAAGSRAGRSSPLVMVFTAAFAQIFVASMFSGGYYDSRFLFIFGLAILATSPRAQDREGDSRRALRPTTGSSA